MVSEGKGKETKENKEVTRGGRKRHGECVDNTKIDTHRKEERIKRKTGRNVGQIKSERKRQQNREDTQRADGQEGERV